MSGGLLNPVQSRSTGTGETNVAMLFVLGGLDWLQENQRRTVSGQALFEDLSSKGVWFCSRPVHAYFDIQGTPAIFYLKHVGVIAEARIDAMRQVEQSDFPLLTKYGLAGYFRTAFRVSDVVAIDPPISLKPLISKLGFITNKGNHWGTSLRTTPRTISVQDLNLILSARLSRNVS